MKRIGEVILILVCIGIVIFVGYKFINKNESGNTIESIKGDKLLELVDQDIKFKKDTTVISNEKCDSDDKKTNYTIRLEDNEVSINNLDNFVNFSLDKFKNAKAITSISYDNICDKSIYIILSSDGKLYFTNNKIVTLKNVKKISDEFILFDTQYKFDKVSVGEDNKLYVSSENKLYRVNLNNSEVMK